MALILAVAVGLGSLVIGEARADGDGTLSGACCCCGCCFFAAVRFFDDGMFAGDVAVKNSCWHVVESENAGWTRGSWGSKTRNRRVNSE